MRAYYFWAGYCGFCKWARKEIIDPLIADGAEIEPIDCMRNPDTALRYNVNKVPVLVFVDDMGNELKRLYRGAITKEAIADTLEL